MANESDDHKGNYKEIYHAERQKRIWDALFYGHQRIDVLVITIAGAGIYLCLETFKYLNEHGYCSHVVIKISAFCLLLTIILNLISQYISTKIHSLDYGICEYCLSLKENDIKKCHKEITKREKLIEKFEKQNNVVTITSYSLLAIGLTFLIIYFCFIF